MSWDHKAYAFDWVAFDRSLRPILVRALKSDEADGLIAFITRNRKSLSDPNEGEPLGEDWQSQLEPSDVQALGDLALTRFYRPSENFGLDGDWADLEEVLSESDRSAFLGQAIGPKDKPFDPGRMGSYFQPPEQVKKSLAMVRELDAPELEEFDSLAEYRSLLALCTRKKLGLYVTF